MKGTSTKEEKALSDDAFKRCLLLSFTFSTHRTQFIIHVSRFVMDCKMTEGRMTFPLLCCTLFNQNSNSGGQSVNGVCHLFMVSICVQLTKGLRHLAIMIDLNFTKLFFCICRMDLWLLSIAFNNFVEADC